MTRCNPIQMVAGLLTVALVAAGCNSGSRGQGSAAGAPSNGGGSNGGVVTGGNNGGTGTSTPSSTPGAPSALVAAALSATQVELRWVDQAANEIGFKVERQLGTGAFVQIGVVAADITGVIDSAVNQSTAYSYRVRAFNAAGDSAYSNVASVTTPGVVSEWQTLIFDVPMGVDTAVDVEVDASGVYVAGTLETINGGQDICVTKIHPSDGSVLWQQMVDGGGGGAVDQAHALVLVAGDLYVTGVSDGDVWVCRIDASLGRVFWQTTIANGEGREIVADASGAYIAGFKDGDALMAKLAQADGAILWQELEAGDAVTGDVAWSLTLDATGVYGGGFTQNVATDMDAWVSKRDLSSGALLWERNLGVANDACLGLSLGLSGVLVHGGEFLNTHWVAAVDPTTGATVWTTALPGTQFDVTDMVNGQRRAMGSDSNLVCVGATTGGVGDVIISYVHDVSGILMNQVTLGSAAGEDRVYGLLVDGSSQAVFVTGSMETSAANDRDAYVVELDFNGFVLWEQTFNGSASKSDRGRAVAVDGAHVYAVGEMNNNGSGTDMWVKQLRK